MRRTGRRDARTAGPAPSGRDGSVDSRLDAGLERLSRAFAIAGGMLLIGVVGMTVSSILGRHLFGMPIPGDYEITELTCGIAVFAFFPHCHVTNANVVVGFFTSRLRPRHRIVLDTMHSMAFTFVAVLIAWRLFVGGVRKLEDGETTLFLEIPIHWAYFAALIAAGLWTAVCLLASYRHVQALRR